MKQFIFWVSQKMSLTLFNRIAIDSFYNPENAAGLKIHYLIPPQTIHGQHHIRAITLAQNPKILGVSILHQVRVGVLLNQHHLVPAVQWI
jgi:hypothetical protein